MRFSKSIPFSIFVLLVFATLMAIASIRAIYRLVPEIDRINRSNTQSLYLIDNMLLAEVNSDLAAFEENLNKEKENITETEESDKIAQIDIVYKKAFEGDTHSKRLLISALADLAEINRLAMIDYAQNAKKLSIVGTWVIVFMIIIVWSIGLIILGSLKKTIIEPLKELEDVLNKVQKGNKLRRCPTTAPTADFQKIYDGVNELLDK